MSLILFPECLRGWLDYPGHSVLFSRPLRGVPWDFSCGHPIGISFQDLTRRPSSSQAVLSRHTLVDTRWAFLFKTDRGVTWYPTGISFKDLLWRPSSSQAVYLATLLWIPDWHFFYISSGLSGGYVSPDPPHILLLVTNRMLSWSSAC